MLFPKWGWLKIGFLSNLWPTVHWYISIKGCNKKNRTIGIFISKWPFLKTYWNKIINKSPIYMEHLLNYKLSWFEHHGSPHLICIYWVLTSSDVHAKNFTLGSIYTDWVGQERRFTPQNIDLLLTIPKSGVWYLYVENWLNYAHIKTVQVLQKHPFWRKILTRPNSPL